MMLTVGREMVVLVDAKRLSGRVLNWRRFMFVVVRVEDGWMDVLRSTK